MESRPSYGLDLPEGSPARDVYTPSRLNREARVLLERGFGSVWIEGEISNLSRPSSGHWYFSLKDQGAQLRCAMFRQRNLLTRFTAADGMHVLARGRVSLYEPRGDYQFIADYLEEAGEGALRRKFELLKTRLAAEGLFAPERKRPLPRVPRRIGIVTSPTGAAVRDILHILARRFPSVPLLIYPVQVQGKEAAGEIAAMLRLAGQRAECDVLILARGGGSLEDLWGFNEEIVAHAIYASPIPVVTGIGHEIDFTIADFVADVRAPTPSGAAELVVPDCAEWRRSLLTVERRVLHLFDQVLGRRRDTLKWLRHRLDQLHPGTRLRQHHQRVDELEQRLVRTLQQITNNRRGMLGQLVGRLGTASPRSSVARLRIRLHASSTDLSRTMRLRIANAKSAISAAARTLNAVSPLATLERGYAIVLGPDGHVVTAADAVRSGDRIEARLARGRVHAIVDRTVTEPGPQAPVEAKDVGT